LRVLVTGGAGFIGSHTVDKLLEKGHTVRVLDNLSEPVHLDGKIPSYLPIDQIEFIHGDVNNRELLLKALKDIDIIYHFAAYQDYLLDFSKFFYVNSVSTALIYELLIEYSIPVRKIIIASSQAVLGEGRYICENHGTFIPVMREDQDLSEGSWDIKCSYCKIKAGYQLSDETVISPNNQYAISKFTQELIAFNLGKRYDLPTVALRYSIVQGPRQSFSNAYSGVMRIFSLSLHHKRPPTIYEDGEQVRDFVNIDDVVNANLIVLDSKTADFEVFNVGGGNPYTVNEFYQRVESIYETGIKPILDGSYRFGDTRNIISDITKLKKLGWKPKATIDQSILSYKKYIEEQSTSVSILVDASKKMKDLLIVRQKGSRS